MARDDRDGNYVCTSKLKMYAKKGDKHTHIVRHCKHAEGMKITPSVGGLCLLLRGYVYLSEGGILFLFDSGGRAVVGGNRAQGAPFTPQCMLACSFQTLNRP